MPPDETRDEDVRAWLTLASTDLRAAAHDLKADPPLVAATTFHAQQAVEKTIKAFLSWHDVPFRRTHDLTELGGQAVDIEAALDSILVRASYLTQYAWRFRYPAEDPQPTLTEAEEALAVADAVLRAVLERLPEALRP